MAGLLLGMTEGILSQVLIESLAVLLLAIVGVVSVMFGPFSRLIYLYKLLALIALVLCGGYMLLAMFLIILAHITEWTIVQNRRNLKSEFMLALVFTIYTTYTLALLGIAVSSHALHRAIEAHEEILKLIRSTAPLS